jgi:hypothetical protein
MSQVRAYKYAAKKPLYVRKVRVRSSTAPFTLHLASQQRLLSLDVRRNVNHS